MNRILMFAAAAVPLLADASLKGAALLVLAGGCVLVMRRASASARHMVWLAAMVALLIVPVLSVVLPGWRVLPRWTVRQAVVADVAMPRVAEKPALTALPTERPTVVPASPPRPVPVPEAVRPSVPVLVASESPKPFPRHGWLLPIWAAGCVVLVLRLTAAHVLLRRSTRRCEPANGALVAALEAARVECGVRQPVRLLMDKGRTIPVVWGIFRPQLLLPAEAEQWNATQLRSVLLHELAHLRRRDPLTQFLTQLACALHWFNPLVWLAAWRLHVERERACDDLVLARGVKPSAYAEHLLQIATQLSPARWTQACGLAMARKSSIEGRLHAVLSDKLNRRSVTRALTAAALMLGAIIAVPLAMLRAADEKWDPPHGAHIGGNDFSAVCVHDGKESSFVIAYRGDFDSSSDGGSNAKARTWTNSGTITLKKPGVVLGYHRVHTAPGKLSLTTGPSEGRESDKAAPPLGNFGQKEYDLAKGRVFLLSDDGRIRQLDIPTPVVRDQAAAQELKAKLDDVRLQDMGDAKPERRKVDWSKFPTYDKLDNPFSPGKALELAANPEVGRDLMFMILQASVEKAPELRPLLRVERLIKNDDPSHSHALALSAYDFSLNGNKDALRFITEELAKEPGGSDAGALVPLGFIDEWETTIAAYEKHFARGADGAGSLAASLFWEQRYFLYPEAASRFNDARIRENKLDDASLRGVWKTGGGNVSVVLRLGENAGWEVKDGDTVIKTDLKTRPWPGGKAVTLMDGVRCGRLEHGKDGTLVLSILNEGNRQPPYPNVNGVILTKEPGAPLSQGARESNRTAQLPPATEAQFDRGDPVNGLRGAITTGSPEPRDPTAQALYELWQPYARLSGEIPGALIGELAAAVKVFIGYNPTWETVPRLNEILPRLDATRDWKAADAIALLDELAALQDSPLQTAAEKMTAATIRQGEALPERFAGVAWGETQPTGLRAAWVLEPGAAEHRMGTALKARLLVQNAGTIPVMARVPTWHQGGVSARDAAGREVEVSGIDWTTIARLVPVCLAPGEYVEINAPGVGLGKDAGRGPWAGPRVGSNVLGKDGAELILTHGLIPLDGSGVGMREDAPHLIGPGWWQAHIKERLSRELPLPSSGAKRTHLLDRAVRDLFATTPTADEIAAFATDQSDGAFDALVQRLAARVDRVEFSGSLPTVPVKFRVLPADPGTADKTPRVVLGPGEYPLSGGTAARGAVMLKIVGRPVGDRRTNDAQIQFEAAEATGKLPPNPHKIEIPDGWGTWAIVCRPGEGFFYLLHKGGARKIDYNDPAKVTDLPATVVPTEFRDEVKRQLDLAGVAAELQAEVLAKPAAPASETGEAGPPDRTHLWNDKYAAVAYQTEKDVRFVLVHEGFISTGIGESFSPMSGTWSIEGNIHLVDSKLTAAAGKNVDKRVIAVKHTSDEPGTLYLDGKAYALGTGRVFVLGDEGEPIQTSRSMVMRTKEDLVKIGDMAMEDMKRARQGKAPEPKSAAAVQPVTDGKSAALVLRADGHEPIVILTGRALTVLPDSTSREGGLTMDVATSDKTITIRYTWPEDAPGFLDLKAGGYPVSRFDLSRGRVFFVHFEKLEFSADVFQVPAGIKVPAIDSPAALTEAAAAVTAWYASCDDRARWESSRVVVPDSEFKSGKPLDAPPDKIVWGEANEAGLRLGIGGLEPGVAYPVGQTLPVKQYIRNDSGKTMAFSTTQVFNEGVGGELVRKADGKKFPHQRGYPWQGFFDRVRLAAGHYIELGSGPMRTTMAEKDGSSPGGMDMLAHGFTVLPGEYTLQLTHGIGQFLGRPMNFHFGDPRGAPGLGEWTGVLMSAAVPLRLADEQVKTANPGDSEAFGSQYMIAFDKGVIRLRHYKGYPNMSQTGGPWEDGSRDWKIPAADGEYVAAWAVGGKGLWVKDASGITHLIVKENLTEIGKWTLEQAAGGRGDMPAGVRAVLGLPPVTVEPFDFRRLPNEVGAAVIEGEFFEMLLSQGVVLKVPHKGGGFFIESGGRAYGPADANPVIELGLVELLRAKLAEQPNTEGLEMLRHMIADGRGGIRDCAFRLLSDLKAPQAPFDYDAVFHAMIGASIEDENGPKDLTPEARMGYAWMHGLFHSTRLEWERTRPLLTEKMYQPRETVSPDAAIVWTPGPDGLSLGVSVALRGGASLEIGKSVPVAVYLRNDSGAPVKLSAPDVHNPVVQISLSDAAGKVYRAIYPFSPGVTGYRHYELAVGTAVKVAAFDLEAHATPEEASRAAHKEGKEHNPRLAVPAGSYELQLEYRNYQETPVPKDAGAEWTGKVTAKSLPLTVATAAVEPTPEAPAGAAPVKPQHESAKSLFRKWQAGARTDGKIPGGLIGGLARTTDEAVKQITDAEVSAKLAALRPRLDASRDWTQAEAVALLDEIAAIATAPVSWADDAMQSSLERVVRQGEPLPKELEGAAWGAPAANGLRAAWLLEPRAEQYPLGSVLKARVLFHNAGKVPMVFETATWHQDDGHTARDEKGAEITVKTTWFTGITPTSEFRLEPGEYCEVSGHGIAIGAGEYKDEHSTGAVGAIIEAKDGDAVILTHSVDTAEGGWTKPGDPKDPGQLIDQYVRGRILQFAPMPEGRADRELIIRRTTPEILGVLPTAEEIAAFVADDASNALEKLAGRLVKQRAERDGSVKPWSGKLPTGETKFRVVAADPAAAKRPRVASAPGRYVLGDGVHLQVRQVTEGDRRVNSAEILFFGPDPKKESVHKPYVITLPEGARVYGMGWIPGVGELWVMENGLVRRYEFTDPGAVKEVRIESGSIGDIPEPLRGAMKQAFGELAATGQQQRASGAGARRVVDWGKFPAYDELDDPFVPEKALELAAKAKLESDEVRRLMFMILQASVEKTGELQSLLKDDQLKRKDDEYHSLALALAAYDYSLNGNREALQFLLDELANGPAGDVQAAVPFGFIDEWELTLAAHEKHFARGADGAAGESYGLFWEQRSVLYPEQFARYQEKATKASGLDPESRRGVWTGSKDGVSVALRFGDDVSWVIRNGEGFATATLKVSPGVMATHLDVMMLHGIEKWVPCGRVSRGAGGGLQVEIWPHTSAAPFLPRISGLELTKRPSEVPGVSREAVLLDSDVEGRLAWGEPVNGVRAALVRVSPGGDAKPGTVIDLNVVVQNVSEQPVTFRGESPVAGAAPKIVFADGTEKDVGQNIVDILSAVNDLVLPPRHAVVMTLMSVLIGELGPDSRSADPNRAVGYSSGKLADGAVVAGLTASLSFGHGPANAWKGTLSTAPLVMVAAAQPVGPAFDSRKVFAAEFGGTPDSYPQSLPFDRAELALLAGTRPEQRDRDEVLQRIAFLLKLAGAAKDTGFRHLLEDATLRTHAITEAALKAYDYGVNGNTMALDALLERLAATEKGDAAGMRIGDVLAYVDEWERSIPLMEKHVGGDGEGYEFWHEFWLTRACLFPEHYVQYYSAHPDCGGRDPAWLNRVSAEPMVWGETLDEATEAQLDWGEPVDGLRGAIMIRAPGAGKPEWITLVLQNVSDAPLRVADVRKGERLRTLFLSASGKLLSAVTDDEPTMTDVALKPRAVVYLPMLNRGGADAAADLIQGIRKDSLESWRAALELRDVPEGAWKGKLTTGETRGAVREGGPPLRNKTSRALFKMWNDSLRRNGDVPGGLMAMLSDKVQEFIQANGDDAAGKVVAEKLKVLVQRFGELRDWKAVDAMALMDDIAEVSEIPLKNAWRQLGARTPRSGAPLPASLEKVAWGAPLASGLRMAYVLEPGVAEYRPGTVVSARILIHNSGSEPVVFEGFSEDSYEQWPPAATLSDGSKVRVDHVGCSNLSRAQIWRLEPGEFIEHSTGGLGIVIGRQDKERDDWMGGRPLAWMHCSPGDEVTLHHSGLCLFSGTAPEPEWWLDCITERLNRELPLPSDVKEREVLLYRVVSDLYGTAPSAAEGEAFAADRSPEALQNLATLLSRRPHGKVEADFIYAGRTKFRVLPDVPEAALRQRVVSGPGTYQLSGAVRLSVSRRLEKGRVSNEASLIGFEEGKDNVVHKIALPDGEGTWAATMTKGARELWIGEYCTLRRYDFSDPRRPVETRYKGVELAGAPIGAALRAELEAVLAKIPDGVEGKRVGGD